MSWSEGDFAQINFAIGKSRRYHSMMRDFYRRLSDAVTAITALTGTSAFVALFLADRSTIWAKILIGMIAAASTLNLVFGFSKKSDTHDKLFKDFTKLSSELELLPATDKNLQKMRAKRKNLEVEEPSIRRVIDLRACLDEERSWGMADEDLIPLGWWQTRTPLGYFFDFGLSGVDERRAKRPSAAASEVGKSSSAAADCSPK